MAISERLAAIPIVIGCHSVLMIILLFADEPTSIALISKGEVNIAAYHAFPISCPLLLRVLTIAVIIIDLLRTFVLHHLYYFSFKLYYKSLLINHSPKTSKINAYNFIICNSYN